MSEYREFYQEFQSFPISIKSLHNYQNKYRFHSRTASQSLPESAHDLSHNLVLVEELFPPFSPNLCLETHQTHVVPDTRKEKEEIDRFVSELTLGRDGGKAAKGRNPFHSHL